MNRSDMKDLERTFVEVANETNNFEGSQKGGSPDMMKLQHYISCIAQTATSERRKLFRILFVMEREIDAVEFAGKIKGMPQNYPIEVTWEEAIKTREYQLINANSCPANGNEGLGQRLSRRLLHK